jgi:hypothetical protein
VVYEEERWKEMDRDNRGDIPVLFSFVLCSILCVVVVLVLKQKKVSQRLKLYSKCSVIIYS